MIESGQEGLPEHVRVAVVGAGFSGLSVANGLREAGERDFVVLERAGRVGGVWRENVYPGVACDVPSHLYSLSFAPNADWARSFSGGAEIQRYLERVARTRGLLPWIRFGEELLRASWNEPEGLWEVHSTSGELTADVLVLCAGPLTEPIYPTVEGLESFRGATLHTSRWDRTHDFTKEKVAVVGTGASAVQVVPELQRVAGKLTVFQRTPGWVVPRPDRDVPRFERRLLRRFPKLTKLAFASCAELLVVDENERELAAIDPRREGAGDLCGIGVHGRLVDDEGAVRIGADGGILDKGYAFARHASQGDVGAPFRQRPQEQVMVRTW